MSNLRNNNVYFTCPALMADGRDSINTDYKPKNDAFFLLRGNMKNPYEFREYLQSPVGYNSIVNNINNYTTCNPVPFGCNTYPKYPIEIGISSNSATDIKSEPSFTRFFNTIKSDKVTKVTKLY